MCSTSNEEDAAVPERPADVVRPLLGEIVWLSGPGGVEGVVEAGALRSQSSAPQKPVLSVERSGAAAPQLTAIILLRDKDFQLSIFYKLFTAADENSYQSYITGVSWKISETLQPVGDPEAVVVVVDSPFVVVIFGVVEEVVVEVDEAVVVVVEVDEAVGVVVEVDEAVGVVVEVDEAVRVVVEVVEVEVLLLESCLAIAGPIETTLLSIVTMITLLILCANLKCIIL